MGTSRYLQTHTHIRTHALAHSLSSPSLPLSLSLSLSLSILVDLGRRPEMSSFGKPQATIAYYSYSFQPLVLLVFLYTLER